MREHRFLPPLQYVDFDGKTALDVAVAILFPTHYPMYQQVKSYAGLVGEAREKYEQERIDVPAPVFPTDPTGLPKGRIILYITVK